MIFVKLFLTFLKIGAFTFGGGYAMLPLIQEAVLENAWLSEEQIINFIAVSESTPGPFAINISTYIGMTVGNFFGAFCATLGVVLPSFVVILIVAKCYEKFRDSKIVKGCMTGLKPALIGLIGSAVISIGKTVFFPDSISLTVFTNPSFYVAIVLFVSMLILALKKVNPIFIICISAVVGIISGYIIF